MWSDRFVSVRGRSYPVLRASFGQNGFGTEERPAQVDVPTVESTVSSGAGRVPGGDESEATTSTPILTTAASEAKGETESGAETLQDNQQQQGVSPQSAARSPVDIDMSSLVGDGEPVWKKPRPAGESLPPSQPSAGPTSQAGDEEEERAPQWNFDEMEEDTPQSVGTSLGAPLVGEEGSEGVVGDVQGKVEVMDVETESSPVNQQVVGSVSESSSGTEALSQQSADGGASENGNRSEGDVEAAADSVDSGSYQASSVPEGSVEEGPNEEAALANRGNSSRRGKGKARRVGTAGPKRGGKLVRNGGGGGGGGGGGVGSTTGRKRTFSTADAQEAQEA